MEHSISEIFAAKEILCDCCETHNCVDCNVNTIVNNATNDNDIKNDDDLFQFRAMIAEEDKYTFHQSAQTGLIGYLRANMAIDGNGLFSSWIDWQRDLKTDKFKEEFNNVINSLREEGNILHNRKALANYCYSHPQSKMQTEQEYYGVRVDTEKYTYLLRLNPNKGAYNVYCYCYIKQWLDGHMHKARKGIRFIDTHNKELFRIADGGKIRIHYQWGETIIRTCRFVDKYHVEIGDILYHICKWAEYMEQGGHTCEPVWDLPEQCYAILPSSGEIIIIKNGEKGYFKTDIPAATKKEAKEIVDEYNKILGISKAQEKAMMAGSMFGWATPAANPANYDSEGNPIVPAKTEV